MKFHLEIRGVEAAAYLGPAKAGARRLTHAVVVDSDGKVHRVVCARVMPGSIDRFDQQAAGDLTCRPCRQKTRGMTFETPDEAAARDSGPVAS